MAFAVQQHFRDHWRELKHGRPGRRFQERYERARRDERRTGAAHRLAIFAAAGACLIVAGLLTLIPGPALPFYFLAGGLLATESRIVARFMDWSEMQVRSVVAWGKRRWRRLSGPARVLVVVLAAGGSAAAMYLGFKFVTG